MVKNFITLFGTNYDIADGANIASQEASTTASAAHAKGSYFILNGYLYKATADIATGGTITEGTNCALVKVGDEVEGVEAVIDATLQKNPSTTNLLDYTKITAGKYQNPNGTIEDISGRYLTDYIPVVSGKKVVASMIAAIGNSVQRLSVASSCFFDADKNVVSGGEYNKYYATVPTGAAYVRLTVANTTFASKYGMVSLTDDGEAPAFHFYLGNPKTAISESVIIPEKPLGYMRATGNLSDGQSLTLGYHNVKNQNVLVFAANITTFDKLKIGKQTDTYIIIDDTNLTVYREDLDPVVYAHGLTIANDIQVMITNEDAITPSLIRLVSGGDVYEPTYNGRFLMDEGSAYATSDGSKLTDCVLSWTSRNINKPIWLFGDSYFSWYAQRWTYYLAQDGYTKSCMLNGFAGQGSGDAYDALTSLLKIRVPQYVVWCLGMNDPDGESAVSFTWKRIYDAVVDLANYYGFTLILATIPVTPTYDNSYKNAIVRESGYRYIDFDKAVDPSGDGTWIDGTREENGVHPTIKGAKILYHQALADLPELATL